MKQAEHSTLRLPFKELSSAFAISETAHMLTTKHIFDCFAGVMHKVRGTEDVVSKSVLSYCLCYRLSSPNSSFAMFAQFHTHTQDTYNYCY